MSLQSSHSIRNEIRENLSLSIPLISSWLIYSFSGFIGTAMVAHLGTSALAASILVNTTWTTLVVLFFGTFSAVSVLVSHQYGARNYDAIKDILSQAFFLACIFCLPIMSIMYFSPIFFHYITNDPKVIGLAKDYAHAQLWCTPALLMLVIFEQFFNGMGKPKLSLTISLIEVPIEIFFIYLFVFGKFGMPRFGIAGVGYGFAATFTLTLIVLIIFLNYSRYFRKLNLFEHFGKFNKRYTKELLKVGLPVGLMYVIEVSAFTVNTFFIAKFGTTILAAHQVAMQFLGFSINIAFAMAQTLTIRVGQFVGRKDAVGIYYASYVGIGLGFMFMFVVFLCYLLFPEQLLRVDFDIYDPANATLIKQAVIFLMILSVFQLFDNLRITTTGALRGLKDTRFPMIVSIISFWLLGVVFAYLLAFVFNMAGKGIWIGFTMGVSVGAVIVLLRLRWKLSRMDLEKIFKIE